MKTSTTTAPDTWRLLHAADPAAERQPDDPYFGHARTELLDLVEAPPGRVLEIGCGGGATGAELKRRFPGTTVTGVELSAGAARAAQTRLDRVIAGNVETLDFTQCGLAPASVDLVIVADVLEHLHNPWLVLERLRALLAPGGWVLASIPNVRNLWLLDRIVRGSFDYRPEGLLDVTHIRFFTHREMVAMFAGTGFRVERSRFNIDGHLPERVPLPKVPRHRSLGHAIFALRSALDRDHGRLLVSRERGETYRVDGARLTLHGLSPADLDELFSSQIYLVATPVSTATTVPQILS